MYPRKLIKARTKLLAGGGLNNEARLPERKACWVFFGHLALGLELVKDDSLPTMATDGKSLYYNEKFIDGLTEAQVITLIGHEVLHCCLQHLSRRGNRDPIRWNIACDHCCNYLLTKEHFEPLKDWILLQEYGDIHAEALYSKLPEPIYIVMPKISGALPKAVYGDKDYGVLIDDHELWKDIPEEEKRELESVWRAKVAQASNAARQHGKLPGSLETLVSDLLAPTLDWKLLLAERIITNAFKDDYRVMPPTKKHLWRELFLSNVYCHHLEIAVAIDSSGSISDPELKAFISEVSGIADQFASYRVHLFAADSKIQQQWVIETHDPWPTSFKGRGGTNFRPVIKEVTEQLDVPVLVYLTDCYGDYPSEEPPFKVIWVSVSEKKPPWGEYIRLKLE